MTEDTQPGANREVPSGRPVRARKTRGVKESAEDNRLRVALFAALDRTGLNLTEIAARCGLKSPNQLYNLKNGHSETLSIQTYLALARHLNLPITELLGLPDRTPATIAGLRDSAALQVAVDRFARSFAFVREASAQFREQHAEPEAPSFDRAAQIKLLADLLRIDSEVEALAQTSTALLNQLRKLVPELPPIPPL